MKLKMKNYFILIVFSIYFLGVINAQNNSIINIKDAIDVPVINPIQPDTVNHNFKIYFKIDSIALATKVYYWFGTEQESANIISYSGIFEHNLSNHALQINNQQINNLKYEVGVPFQIPISVWNQINYLTLFVEDNNGANTNKLFIQLK